jgi:uncharacterized protein YndB with AHSA1/START domain
MTAEDETILVLVRRFAAPPEQVFDAWTAREQWQAWIGPEGVTCDVPALDARPGGAYRVDMRMSDGSLIPVAGEFRTVDRPHRLVFTWGWNGDPDRQSLITLSFEERDGATEFTLRQEGLPSVQSRDDHGRGWSSALNKLGRYLARAPVG